MAGRGGGERAGPAARGAAREGQGDATLNIAALLEMQGQGAYYHTRAIPKGGDGGPGVQARTEGILQPAHPGVGWGGGRGLPEPLGGRGERGRRKEKGEELGIRPRPKALPAAPELLQPVL